MTKDENTVKTDQKAGSQDRPHKDRGEKKERVKPPTKIIIRHLPPTMTEEEFLKQIDPLPEHDFYYFSAADWSLGYDATCRAYITLKNYDDVFLFRDRFDGYIFVDSKGAEYAAIVEFAPFQGCVKNKSRRSDNKVNTIEQEPHYQQFLAKLEEDREAAAKGGECKLEFSLDRKKEEKITSTPLLQYLANKKERRREEAKRRTEEKRRQREEEKEKQKQQQTQQQVTKIISSGTDNKGRKEGQQRYDVQNEQRKNARLKRRAERVQRRREEQEQRKRDKERKKQDQKERSDSLANSDVPTDTKAETESKADEESGSVANEGPDEESKQRKDVKKYSERREQRDRERNRNRREKENENEGDPEKSKTMSVESVQAVGSVATKTNDGEISDTVMSFIRSVAATKDRVPQHKQEEVDPAKQCEQQLQTPAIGEEAVAASDSERRKVTSKGDSNSANSQGDQKLRSEQKNEEAAAATSEKLTRKQTEQKHAAEERRIRNKDRPSIAIYQPKARLRLSEESDSNPSKDVRSNPTSDCEIGAGKKEEQVRNKKVVRYSERRSERRNRPEQKQKLPESETAGGERRTEMRRSKPTDDTKREDNEKKSNDNEN